MLIDQIKPKITTVGCSAELLDEEAGAAWQAYSAMEATKARHFGLLEIIDNKKKNYNIDPTDADKQMLKILLDEHSAQVKRFTDACEQLKSCDPDKHKSLFEYIGSLGAR